MAISKATIKKNGYKLKGSLRKNGFDCWRYFFTGKNVTTAVVDTLTFNGPAHPNDTIIICGYVTYVGKTSMEICTKTYVENLDGSRKLINTAYLVMVALDENEKPTPVPGLVIESYEEKIEWEAAQKRAALRKQRRAEKF